MFQHSNLDKIFTVTSTVKEYSEVLEQCSPNDMAAYLSTKQGSTPFYSIFDHIDAVAVVKIKILFKHAKRLNIDPNKQFNPIGFPDHVRWNNSPIHVFIANERFELIKPFLDNARENDFKIDLNLVDRERKTPFLLAVKMGNISVQSIQLLITKENYNLPDSNGITPIMLACALRRVDIIKLILQAHANNCGLAELNFNQLTVQQKCVLSAFINQQHTETGKSLLHFAVLREGIDIDMAKPVDYQQTVLNILKSVGIDGRRDVNAKRNSPINDLYGVVTFGEDEKEFFKNIDKKAIQLNKLGLDSDPDQLEMIFTDLSWNGPNKINNAILATKRNSFSLLTKTMGTNADKYKNLKTQIFSYKGMSFAADILSRTQDTVEFLLNIGVTANLKQKHGDKTPTEYIETLIKNADQSSKADKNYIFPMLKKIQTYLIAAIPEELNDKTEANSVLSP